MAVEILTVTTTLDQNDGSTTGGLSLRDALMIANANTNNEYIIELQGGSDYFLTLGSGSSNDDVESGDLDIYAGANITIRSLGNEPARIDATSITNGDRVFHVLDDGTLTLEKVIVSGGSGVGYGGGIYVGFDATLNLLNTTITDNTAGAGGGIYNYKGNVFIYNSSIISNTANNFGGGISNFSNLTIVNSTISNNVANGDGGGIYNGGNNVTIVNSTITDNDADNNNNSSSSDVGGGIYSYSTIVLRNSIIANNTKDGGTVKSDLSGSSFQGNLHNLVGVLNDVRNSTIGTGSDIVLGANGSAGLGALQNNGGFTPTHALLAGSPAIDAGNNSLQSVDAFDIDGDGDTGEPIPYDQIGNNRLNNGKVDIGATEFYVSLSVNDVSATEGGVNGKDFVFEVSLNASLNQVVTVDYATVNDSAIAGSDYVSTSGTLTFNPGETTKNVTVKILGDETVEPNEKFLLSLSNSQNALIEDGTGQGTIINDNFIKPTISINDFEVSEGNTGRKDGVFTITLSEPTTVPVTVSYGLEDGTATVGNDYLASQGEVVFQPSETSKTIAIGILGDMDIENNETFSVKLSNPVNGTLNKASGTGTITNDDSVIDDGNNNGNDDNNNGNDDNNNGNDDNNNGNDDNNNGNDDNNNGNDDNNNASADLLINRFQNTARQGTYLFASEQESSNIRSNFPNFAEEGTAFRVFSQPGDDLMRINRFQNSNVPGTYLYANEQESLNIRRDFPNFKEEGVAFYAYGADANKGRDFYRFQNTQQPGTYIFVGEEEKNNIVANFPQFSLEGVAFEVG